VRILDRSFILADGGGKGKGLCQMAGFASPVEKRLWQFNFTKEMPL